MDLTYCGCPGRKRQIAVVIQVPDLGVLFLEGSHDASAASWRM